MSRSEQQEYRKTQRMIEQTHGGFAGPSIIEMLTGKLDHAMECYLFPGDRSEKARQLCRGEVRGLARAISLMQNPYHPTRQIKTLEQESASRVRRAHAQERSAAQEGQPAQ